VDSVGTIPGTGPCPFFLEGLSGHRVSGSGLWLGALAKVQCPVNCHIMFWYLAQGLVEGYHFVKRVKSKGAVWESGWVFYV
jgi:hypothetical protein